MNECFHRTTDAFMYWVFQGLQCYIISQECLKIRFFYWLKHYFLVCTNERSIIDIAPRHINMLPC